MTASVRIDKWLWAARFFKTRAAATEAVLGGRVRVNGERVKPAKHVHAADIVEVRIGEVDWTITVLEVADKRGSAVSPPACSRRPPTRWQSDNAAPRNGGCPTLRDP